VAVNEPLHDKGDSKKRKREEPEIVDPKLQEYLKVVGTKRESALAEQSGDALTATVAEKAVPVVAQEDESDDEYEQIPSKKEKQRKLDHKSGPTPESGVEAKSDELAMRREGRDTTAEATQAVVMSADSEPGAGGAAETDDDWLRTRTNRLLDLADPDDLDLVPPPITSRSTAKDADRATTLGETPQASDVVMNDVPEHTPETQGRDAEDNVDVIRRTARLFVRNLPYSATEDDLRELFSAHGTIAEVCCSLC
jgi:multiple RNA-binding domain-containing protein 1